MNIRQLLLPAILLLSSSGVAGTFPIRKFGGLNTEDSHLLLQNGQTRDSQNVITDNPAGGLEGREGFTEYSTTTAVAQWEFPHSDGTRYFIVHDDTDDTLKATTGDGTFSTTVSTVAASVTTVGTVLGDKFFFSNTTDGLKYWDTSSVTVADADMKFTGLVTHAGRLWGIGVPTYPRTVYASAFNDGTDWTLVAEPADDDPAQFVVGGALDEVLMALKSFRGALMWFKARSFGAILGVDRSDFEVKTYSDETGTAYKDSIQDCSGILRWLGPLRTVWEFDGAGFGTISDDIDSLMGTITQGDANARAYSVTSQTEWGNGSSGYGLSTTEVAGDLMFTAPPTVWDQFTDADYTSDPTWTSIDEDGSPEISATSGYLYIYESAATSSYATLYSSMPYASTDGYIEAGLTFVGNYDSSNKIAFLGVATSTKANNAGISNGYFCYYYYGVLSLNDCASGACAEIGNVNVGLASMNTEYTFGLMVNGGVVRVYWDGSEVLTVSDGTHTSFSYITLRGIGLQNSAVQDAQYCATKFDDIRYQPSDADWTSEVFSMGDISSFGLFAVTDNADSGTISYTLYTDSDTTRVVSDGLVSSGYVSSQTITSGSLPTVSTAAYGYFGANLAVTDFDQTPGIQDITLNWNEGSQIDVASGYPSQRYWLSVAVNSATNNRIFVYDKNQEWQKYVGINAASLGIYNGRHYFANSSGIFLAEEGYDDDGTDITAYYTTPEFSPSGWGTYSYLDYLFVTTDRSASTLATVFHPNGITGTDYSLGSIAMNATTGTQNRRIPWASSEVQKMKSLDLKFTVTGSAFWRLLGADLYYQSDPYPMEY